MRVAQLRYLLQELNKTLGYIRYGDNDEIERAWRRLDLQMEKIKQIVEKPPKKKAMNAGKG